MSMTVLFERLVDDAGLFPPTALDMAAALDRHRADRAAGQPVLTHRFLCPASRVAELRAELGRSDGICLALIADQGTDGLGEVLDGIGEDGRLSVALLEFPLGHLGGEDPPAAVARSLEAVRELPAGAPAFFESRGRVEALLEAIRRSGGRRPLGAKVRCGGVRAELFPSCGELAHFIVSCVAAGVPFKATAGLHHAVRHRDPATGFVHHGYLNLLLATADAVEGADRAAVAATLEVDDGAELIALGSRVGAATAEAARRSFVAYGACSTSTPASEADQLTATAERND